MHTHLSLAINVPDDTLMGDCSLYVSRWKDDHLIQTCLVWQGVVILPTIIESGGHYQWAGTVLKEIDARARRAIAEALAEGQVKPMVVCREHQEH